MFSRTKFYEEEIERFSLRKEGAKKESFGPKRGQSYLHQMHVSKQTEERPSSLSWAQWGGKEKERRSLIRPFFDG
jgi:hypothetical protein